MYPIQTFWHGPMSDLERMCLRSWTRVGHPVYLYTYEEHSDLPDGVSLLDARDILPTPPGPPTAFSCLPFSDRFRYTMLRMNGGLWLDLDIILLRPIPTYLFEQDFWCGSERTLQSGTFKSKDTYKPVNGILFVSEPEHPLMCDLTEATIDDSDPWSGSKLFRRYLKDYKGVLQPSAFCDMNWWSVKEITSPIEASGSLRPKWGCRGCSVTPPKEAIGIHLWRGLLRKYGIKTQEKDVSPLSYLGRLYQLSQSPPMEQPEACSPSQRPRSPDVRNIPNVSGGHKTSVATSALSQQSPR